MKIPKALRVGHPSPQKLEFSLETLHFAAFTKALNIFLIYSSK